MFRKGIILASTALLIASAIPAARAQVTPSATQTKAVLTVGVGASSFIIDWGNTRKMEGPTVWLDYKLPLSSKYLSGLGIEVEGRDINYFKPRTPPRMRQSTALIGAFYRFHHMGRFQPYGKYLAGIGSIDFPPFSTGATYTHDTRTVLAPGGGVDYHLGGRFNMRLDYEYQSWLKLFRNHNLSPNGLTLGVTYSFGGKQ
jgi:opacity protein-like surface antigen